MTSAREIRVTSTLTMIHGALKTVKGGINRLLFVDLVGWIGEEEVDGGILKLASMLFMQQVLLIL